MRWKTLIASALAIGASPIACGDRTGLWGDSFDDAGSLPPFDAARDRATRPDSGVPPIDGQVVDVDKSGCNDASVSSAVVVTVNSKLMRFSPSSGFSDLPNIGCGPLTGRAANSMALRRDTHAFVMYLSINPTTLDDVDLSAQTCARTPFVATPNERFGMGFTTIGVGPAEELFVVDSTNNMLTKITPSFQRSPIGKVKKLGELAGGGDGRLFHFYSPDDAPGSRLAELDKTTGVEIAADPLFDVAITSAWAMARFGNDFYLFTTSASGGTDVTRYDLGTKVVTRKVFVSDKVIVGAGASTCASP